MVRGACSREWRGDREDYLESPRSSRLERLLPYTLRAPKQAVEHFTAHEVGREGWMGF